MRQEAKINKKKRNIGSARFSIAAGRTAVLDVKINKAARGRERSVRARASAQDARRRTPVVTTSKVMLKPAPAAAR